MRKEDSVKRHNDHAFFYLDCPFFCRVIQLQYLVGWCILTFSIDTAWWMGVCCWVKAVGYAWRGMGMWVEWDGDGDGDGVG